MTFLRSFGVGVAVLALSVVLSACMGGKPLPVPEGVQEVGGYVEVVPFSLKRRGTHALFTQSGGDLLFYLESRDVNLRTLERSVVRLRGIFERNTDPALPPVLVVDDIMEGQQQTLRPWSIPALQMSLRLPSVWTGTLKGKTAEFTENGSLTPLLRIATAGNQAATAGVQHMNVGLRDAIVQTDASAGLWIVRVPFAGREDVIFSFTLEDGVPAELQRPAWERMLRTVQWNVGAGQQTSAPSSASAMSTPGDATGAPCGGPAGILCPAGFYCKITDNEIEAGVCAKR